jgi:ribulose kinase
MLGAVAAGDYASVTEAMTKMSAVEAVIEPCQGAAAMFHEAKHEVFLKMYEDQLQYKEMMSRVS